MEIIKEPNMQTICQKCGCEFKFDKENIHRYGCALGVNCPICKTVVKIWSKE